MGLDMYLTRMKKYKRTTPEQVNAIDGYLDWLRKKEEGYDGTLEQWCGVKEEDLPAQDSIDFYKSICRETYSNWDIEKKYPYYRIDEQIGYWRKCNQIHNWFVENVQNGEDNCGIYKVHKEHIEDLLDICQTVLDSCKLVPGKVYVGTTYKNGEIIRNYEDGLVVEDNSVAMELLPPCEGFFFGGYDIDQYYIDGIKDTIDILTIVLETTDFETEMIAYSSSW